MTAKASREQLRFDGRVGIVTGSGQGICGKRPSLLPAPVTMTTRPATGRTARSLESRTQNVKLAGALARGA